MCLFALVNKMLYFVNKRFSMANYIIRSEITQNRELLEAFKKTFIDPHIFVGQLYKLTSACGFNKFNTSNSAGNTKITLQANSIVFITKIRIVESIDYFNMGPALVISVLYQTSSYHLFIFPNQISKSSSSPSSLKYSIPNNVFVHFNTLFAKI